MVGNSPATTSLSDLVWLIVGTAVNSILIAKLYLNVSRITEFTRNQDETILAIQTHFHWVTSLTGVVFPPSCRPSSFIMKVKVSESIFGPLNRLKISEAEVFT